MDRRELLRNNMIALRSKTGMDRVQAAKAIGIQPTCLKKHEHGISLPSLDTLDKICTFYNTTPNDLLGYRDE